MRSIRQHIAVVLVATLGLAACGVALAFLLARGIALRVAHRQLAECARRAQATAELYSIDARTTLAAMNASTDPFCSDAEIAHFRLLLFRAEHLKDAGRMRDGVIACSTTLGRNGLTKEIFRPMYLERDGTRVYWDVAPLRLGKRPTAIIQVGDSYVALDAQFQSDNLPGNVVLKVTLRGAHGPESGQSAGTQDAAFTRDGTGQLGDQLYATNCSARRPHCVTALLPVAQALRTDRIQFAAYLALGGFAGGLLGFFGSLQLSRKRTMVQQLRRALRHDKLRMVYQPVVDLATGRIVGAEALARWRDEEGFAVAPDVFVRLAEEQGFVGQITKLALRHSLHDFGAVLRADPSFRLSVNVTAADLSDSSFLPMLQETLAREQILPPSLTLEITEGATVRHGLAIEAIRRLRANGHHVHIDDFGTGYSSLSYLKDLDVDAIKIDRAFTQSVGTGSVTIGILPQILSMAETLKLGVVVEGIETEEQARYFTASTLPLRAQGWLFGRPLDPADFHRRLAKGAPASSPAADWPEVGQPKSSPGLVTAALRGTLCALERKERQ